VKAETLLVKREGQVLAEVQLPLVEQVLIFGKSQVTTQAIRACLQKYIPIVYLSRMGYCYGRIALIERGYRYLSRYQQQLSHGDRLIIARAIVGAKLKNSRVILLRQQRRRGTDNMARSIQSIEYLIEQSAKAESIDRLMGFEGSFFTTS
jgi:CRISPR-associated protein Cas1